MISTTRQRFDSPPGGDVARRLALAITLLGLFWTALLLTAPLALGGQAPSTIPAALVYHSAGRVCHQRPERSFNLAGVQQPVCARCFGLYASGAAGALLGWIPWRRRALPGGTRGLLLVAAVPTALTWSLELLGLIGFGNAVRAIAAVPLGATAGWVFVRALRAPLHPSH